MADLLKIGLSGLLAQQRALTATANNIANASTPGYSRQRVELVERPGERFGSGYIGTGVDVAALRRVTDDILLAQTRSAATQLGRSEAFAGLAAALDNLLADEQTGLNSTIQSFVNAVQDVANDPASSSSRQVLLSEARSLAARFQSMGKRLDQIDREVTARLSAAAAEITSLGRNIAELNRQLLAHGGAEAPPPDLLDQRDRLLERLAQLVNVEAIPQDDGTMSVFIGSGQVLVLGTTASELTVAPGALDPREPDIVLEGAGGSMTITQFLGGGELGGVLDFRREMLVPTRAGIGRIAVGLASVVNTAHRNGMDLDGNLGGDLFRVAPPQSYAAASNTGTAAVGVSLADVSALQAVDYRMAFDGATWRLFRMDNGAEVALSGAGTAADPFTAGGLEIVVSGSAAAGDQFLLRPFADAASGLTVLITNPAKLAAAAPIRTRVDGGNLGDGTISAGEVVDVSDPNLLTSSTIEFIDPSTYSVNGVGSFAYTPGADIVVNGARLRIDGSPAAGDRFVIESNAGGAGDNRNALAIIGALSGGLFDGGTASIQSAVGSLVTDVGAQTAEAYNRRDAQGLLLEQARASLESVRGVNLDEEAADMLRYEQMYQAAAQTIAVADTLFNTLLAAIGR